MPFEDSSTVPKTAGLLPGDAEIAATGAWVVTFLKRGVGLAAPRIVEAESVCIPCLLRF